MWNGYCFISLVTGVYKGKDWIIFLFSINLLISSGVFSIFFLLRPYICLKVYGADKELKKQNLQCVKEKKIWLYETMLTEAMNSFIQKKFFKVYEGKFYYLISRFFKKCFSSSVEIIHVR